MKIAYVFATPRAASYKLGRMILPQLEAGTHGVEVVGMFFFDDNVFALRRGDPIGERLAAVAAQKGMLLMMCDMCALERGVAEGEPRWCDAQGLGRTEPGECRVKDTVAGVQVGCFPDLYAALAGNPPDQVITLCAVRPGPRTRSPRLAPRARFAYAFQVVTPLASSRESRSFWSLLTCLALLLAAACGSPGGNPKVPAGAKSSGGMHGVIETDKGAIEIEFFAADAPKAVENFRLLAEHGYYDGLTFHRVVQGFMIQGGDPDGTGTGGQSAWGAPFADEINEDSPLYRGGYRRSLIAMANSGRNTNGSQFFILHQDYPLEPKYVIFARVTAGMDVVDALAGTPTAMGADGAMSRPITPPVIKKVTIRP